MIGVGLAIALLAWHERMLPHSDAAFGDHLRIAVVLLLVSAAAMILIAVLIARALPPAGERPAAVEQPSADRSGQRAEGDLSLTASSMLPVPLARMGHLMSIGGLIRGFCHELNNELGPVQGYAELLCGDTRLSELHRRQIARIRDATKSALADIRGFGSALGWSDDPTNITRLGEMAAEAARSAQAALTTRIELDLPAGAEIEVTATEAEVGQAILHLCAAAIPLLGKQDTPYPRPGQFRGRCHVHGDGGPRHQRPPFGNLVRPGRPGADQGPVRCAPSNLALWPGAPRFPRPWLEP